MTHQMTDIFRRSNNYHGKLDLAVANTGGTTVSILRGDGQGGFATPLA